MCNPVQRKKKKLLLPHKRSNYDLLSCAPSALHPPLSVNNMEESSSKRHMEAVMASIDSYNLSTKRTIYSIIAEHEYEHELADVFFPNLGISFGEFCVHNIINR